MSPLYWIDALNCPIWDFTKSLKLVWRKCSYVLWRLSTNPSCCRRLVCFKIAGANVKTTPFFNKATLLFMGVIWFSVPETFLTVTKMPCFFSVSFIFWGKMHLMWLMVTNHTPLLSYTWRICSLFLPSHLYGNREQLHPWWYVFQEVTSEDVTCWSWTN